ncbi:MAG: BatD family protein, partial [Planctomycetota bacterium]
MLYCCSLLCVSTYSWSQETTEVRTRLLPEREANIGERMVLTVDVLARDAWARVPSLPTLEVSGAVVFLPPSQSTRLNETIDGETYTGQRYEWWIYPQRAGDLKIPSLTLDIETKTYVPAESTTRETRTSETQDVRVVVADGQSTPLTFNSIRATQSWSSSRDRTFRVGDGITRTVERAVDDAPSLLLPPIVFEAPSGVRVAPKQANTENQFSRG